MHEYRLYTTIPTIRHTQVQQILAGVTASQPTNITQQVLIYQQLKPEINPAALKKGGPVKPTGPPRLGFVKLVSDVNRAGGKEGSGDVSRWRLREEGLPDPAAKTVISQAVGEREVGEEEMAKFRSGSETHKLVSSYTASGTRFVYHNIVIYLTRLYTNNSSMDALDSPPPAIENRDLLDPSGAWLMEVCLRTDDGGNSTLRDKAMKELEGFKKEVEGSMELKVPDRLALDPRVKG